MAEPQVLARHMIVEVQHPQYGAVKMPAALAARRDPDFVLIARTDVLAVHGWDEVIRRYRAYHQAGADLVFVDGISTDDGCVRLDVAPGACRG